jgi:hypothetical protein
MSFRKSLIVARDRGHVKTLQSEFLGQEVVSASAFFDMVRLLAFTNDQKLVRDDHAPVIFLSKHLADHHRYSLEMVQAFSSLYSACYHGTSSPTQVFEAINAQAYEFVPVFLVLKTIEESMNKRGLVNGVSALFRAWQVIKERQILPLSFAKGTNISLFYLVDLTLLEIEVIKDLSRLGIHFTLHFPLDLQRRGINAAVDFIARQFESSEDLTNVEIIFDDIAVDGPFKPLLQQLFCDEGIVSLSQDHASITVAHDVMHEANILAQKVATLKSHRPDDSIAVAVRTIDTRSAIYQRVLSRFGITFRNRKGLSLLETPGGILLTTLFKAKSNAMAKNDVVGLINHPLFAFYIEDDVERSRIIGLVASLGIDDRILVAHDCKARFLASIERLRGILAADDERLTHLVSLESWLNNCSHILGLLAEHSSLGDHLKSLLMVLDIAIDREDSSVLAIKNALNGFVASMSFHQGDPLISFGDFTSLLLSMLSTTTIPRPDYDDVNAVEFLPLPELLGKKFDHVLIADISFGKMPKNTTPDPLMNDQARIALNALLKKPLLRVFFDDPFEPLPVPPRQALEPLWFAVSIAAAKKTVHFFCAGRDEEGQEQAQSEFFLWLLDHVKIEPTPSVSTSFSSQEDQHFLLGVQKSLDPHAHTHDDLAVAVVARKKAMMEQEASRFAFAYDGNKVKESFLGRLDEEPTKSITPSLIGAFAACRFKGFVERILDINSDDQDADDIEPMVLGQIAHRALELFFNQSDRSIDRRWVSDQINKLTHGVSRDFIAHTYVANPVVLWCHLEWLNDALVNLIERIEHDSWYQAARVVACEQAFGLGKSIWQALHISVNGRHYLLGGRIDRIDQRGEYFLVTDYKLSAIDALKMELNPKNMLVNTFQMPIYMRLAAKNIAHNDPQKVSFAYASIRDGDLISLFHEEHQELFDKVFDDNSDHSLPRMIDGVFAPMMQGEVLATAGEHCSMCDFSYLCRTSSRVYHGA